MSQNNMLNFTNNYLFTKVIIGEIIRVCNVLSFVCDKPL
ncbi:hypothetical protein PAGA_b0488 [Pseudoalteromonas agarivorans DSM 14585]|uniref:Uncharacterized protein n=1 Tax=Pseudoalteromonas agarivorans DSM 14585 TaxID=1312369 RepID=A0ACA8E259_9GAMM|nr:hypothetical protein PAGA_b0488 [Pseudoalteromonas agarivorans DSM 14585]